MKGSELSLRLQYFIKYFFNRHCVFQYETKQKNNYCSITDYINLYWIRSLHAKELCSDVISVIGKGAATENAGRIAKFMKQPCLYITHCSIFCDVFWCRLLCLCSKQLNIPYLRQWVKSKPGYVDIMICSVDQRCNKEGKLFL